MCVVCKGRRRKLAGIANAERKEKRKLLAMQEGGNKKSKLVGCLSYEFVEVALVLLEWSPETECLVFAANARAEAAYGSKSERRKGFDQQ